MQWRPLYYKSLLKSHAAFHVYREHMGKPAIFRPQNKPLCSWTHDRTGSFLPREPHPRGVGPLTVIKPPQFSQQNRSYIKLKYRGLINKAWAGEKKNWVKDGHNDLQTIFPSRSWAVHSHEIHFKTWSRCLPRQSRKNKARAEHRERKASTPALSSNVKVLDCTTMETIPVLAQCCGIVFVLLFSIPHWNSTCKRLPPQMDKNKEIDNNLKQTPLVKTAGRKYIKHFNLKNNINHYQKHVTLTQIHSLKGIINWNQHKPVCFETLHSVAPRMTPETQQRPSHSQWSIPKRNSCKCLTTGIGL